MIGLLGRNRFCKEEANASSLRRPLSPKASGGVSWAPPPSENLVVDTSYDQPSSPLRNLRANLGSNMNDASILLFASILYSMYNTAENFEGKSPVAARCCLPKRNY